MASLGTRPVYDITTNVSVSVDNSYSWTQSKVTFTFTTSGTARVWNHGVLIQVTCNSTTKPNSTVASRDNILVGCKDGWAAQKNWISGSGASKSVSFIIDKSNAAKSVSYTAYAYAGYVANYTSGGVEHNDLRNEGLIKSYSDSVSISGKITSVGTGSTSITNNYNNTFTITGTKGSAGTNNAVNKGILTWTGYKPGTATWYRNSSNNYPSQNFTTASLTKTINLYDLGGLGTENSRYVAVQVTTDGVHNDTSSAWQYVYISQYTKPNPVASLPYLQQGFSYNKNRLTVKEPWTFFWEAATKRNNTSPVVGYRIRLYYDGKLVDIKDANGVTISTTSSNGTDRYYDYDTAVASFTVFPDKQGFEAKHKVALSVAAYSRYGEHNDGSNYNSDTDYLIASEVKSIDYDIMQAGIVRPKINNTGDPAIDWVEGQVWVKIANTGNDLTDWVEADVVKTKVSNTGRPEVDWVESE